MGRKARLKIIKEYDKQLVIQSYINAIKEDYQINNVNKNEWRFKQLIK